MTDMATVTAGLTCPPLIPPEIRTAKVTETPQPQLMVKKSPLVLSLSTTCIVRNVDSQEFISGNEIPRPPP